MELIERGTDAIMAFILDQSDGKTAQARGVLWAVAGTNTATILIPVPVEDMMTRLNRPMVTIECEHVLGIGAVRRMAGDAISEFPGLSAGFLKDHMAFDDIGLTDAGEVEIIVELGCCPDRTRLDAAMGQFGLFTKVRFTALGKGDGQIVEQVSLIAFDRKQIMRLALEDIASQVALGQQRISRECFAGQIDFEGID